jgi:hypothetical protein
VIVENLYEEVLIKPTEKGVNNLFVVSGYSSATFANRHLSENKNFKLNLIIGMPGMTKDHLGYMNLYNKFGDRFNGHYLQKNPPVHSKVYSWCNDNKPLIGYSGSANYSQSGFFSNKQINQINEDDPSSIISFYNDLLKSSVKIKDFEFDLDNLLINKNIYKTLDTSVIPGSVEWEIPNKRVTISFLDRYGKLPQRSGLNWGQRPEQNREPNQAYLSIKKDVRDEGFLPPLSETFTLITDDKKSIDCCVAQQGRKAIHSTFDNSEIGKYIRERIGVKLGNPVLEKDLEKYGRTDFTIEKLNDETFLLDLSVNKQ